MESCETCGDDLRRYCSQGHASGAGELFCDTCGEMLPFAAEQPAMAPAASVSMDYSSGSFADFIAGGDDTGRTYVSWPEAEAEPEPLPELGPEPRSEPEALPEPEAPPEPEPLAGLAPEPTPALEPEPAQDPEPAPERPAPERPAPERPAPERPAPFSVWE